jgi:hypothetical protein
VGSQLEVRKQERYKQEDWNRDRYELERKARVGWIGPMLLARARAERTIIERIVIEAVEFEGFCVSVKVSLKLKGFEISDC